VAARNFSKIAREFRALPRATRSLAELFREAVALARTVVAFDGWAAVTLDPATLLVTGGVHEHGLSPAALELWHDLEVSQGDYLHYPALARELTPVGNLFDATRGELAKSQRHRDVLAPAGYEHELRAALRSMKQTWGGLFLLRRAGAPRFEPEDDSFMRELADALGDAVRSTLRAANVATDRHEARALLLLDQNQRIVARSPASAAVLEELGEPMQDPDAVPHTVRSTVNGARRGSERGTQVAAYVRVKGKSGRWFVVHATVLGDAQVLVTLDEGRPIPLAAPIRNAYDLTAREGELLRDVLLGLEDAQIAERVGVSEAALRAELGVAFAKLGLAKSSDLAKKLFSEHYRERALASAPLDADGWFRA
jgi:DNA-binding NarL/FixJ family response regulator